MPSVTAAARPSPSELLEYLPDHRVLICKECRYAIQPSAISRHLKDLHHIYRSHRQELLEYAKGLQLADPGDVVPPPTQAAPVPFLPTENGLACAAEECTHLCVTPKRMKAHWATAHRDVIGSGSPQWHHVTLQTFFRGNQLRYFVVSGPLSPLNFDLFQTLEANGEPRVESLVPKQSPETDSSPSSLMQEPSPDTNSSSPTCASEIALLSDWTTQEIELFTHFKQFTYYDLGRGLAGRRVWQVPILDMAYDHAFLKHGIMACSALHLAQLQPLHRRQYQMIAACHQARALPLFRTAISTPTEENCNAILAFSQLLIVHCFAAEEQDEDLLLVKGKHESGLPDWLQVIRGSCTMFGSVWAFMQKGVLQPLIDEGIEEEAVPLIPEKPEHAARLKQLLALPFFGNPPLLKDAMEEKMKTYGGALMALARGFARAAASQEKGMFTMWTAVHIWPAQISLEFLELLRQREPPALVLLAHYCVLLGPLERAWYMNGFRKRLLERIYWQLDGEWRTWMEWPFAEAGLEIPDI